ncbi:MAG TPA: hypothetical protein DIW43_13820 [Spongiibacteraceae bacterium]|nr:hypothetical protein [Spongiibacteraceae bacterium]HCS28533.1 hypothetical protein [Spongiibacteraceae bacterium]
MNVARLVGRFRGRRGNSEVDGDSLHIQFLEDSEELANSLSVIPSETSLKERMLLYFLAKEWVVDSNILELGPFLGGTTKALAKGVASSLNGNRKVLTIDRFDSYYSLAAIESMGVAVPGSLKTAPNAPFKSIFDSIHSGKPYFDKIVAHTMAIPDKPVDSIDYSFLKEYSPFGAVFVDGCKSWYSTKNFCSGVVDYCRAGTYFLFQDYGRYTCFWIPVFAECFPESLQLVGSVDSTYIYKLISPLTAERIEERFPDSPQEIDRSELDKIFDRVIQRERIRKNYSALVSCRIQHAAFFAYVGEKERAREMLKALYSEGYVRGQLARRVEAAMKSPTYTPDSDVTL